MGVRKTVFRGALILITASVGFTNAALAQEATTQPETRRARNQETIPQAFNRAYYSHDQTFYNNRNLPRSFTWFLGPFPENEISADGRAVHEFYINAFTRQALSDPTIRTADLANPFDTSLLLQPAQAPAQVPSSSFSTETPPAQAPALAPAPAPTPRPQTRPAPVRGLW
jgi:hypothetical protein